MNPLQKILHPSTLVLLAANAIPLAGVALWHWDAFLLLMLYWMETAIIGFWTILAVAVSPRRAIGNSAERTSRLFLVPFFLVHSGIFMTAHFMILWQEFSGRWRQPVHGVDDFIAIVVIGTGLWIPLLALFMSRGISFLLPALRPEVIPDWLSFLHGRDPKNAPDEGPFVPGRVLYGFYARIIVMQLAILFGGAIAIAVGALAPLILLIALKTVIDLGLHMKADLPAKPKPATVTTA